MEQLNKIELRGIVGRIELQSVHDAIYARFSVMTDYGYFSKDGTPVIETTWHNCAGWVKPEEVELYKSIRKGDTIHLTGRLRIDRYCDENGNDRTRPTIAVQKVLSVDHKAVMPGIQYRNTRQ